MAYEVLARKWRPQQFEDVVGQQHVTQTLQNAIAGDRVAHAYLFVGPRGIGKTTSARIFAKALNCKTNHDGHPCNECDSCKEITSGASLDVIEIDGASNNGVEQVRDLRDNAVFAPVRGPYKIYIIDEVHMLTTQAFNALLKTLEEPPPHVKFVFATTEPHKVPPTILSRCQRFDLRPISTRQIIERLQKIADAEGIEIDNDALLAIARGAEGGLRDAESSLDQLVAFKGNELSEDDVMSVFGLVSRRSLETISSAVLDGDVVKTLEELNSLYEAGKDMQRLLVELLNHFRNILILCYSPEAKTHLDVAEEQIAALKEQAQETNPGRVLRVIEIMTSADQRLRYALSKRTLMEVALIQSARAASVISIDELIERVEAMEKGGGGSAGLAATSEPAVAYEVRPRKRKASTPAASKITASEKAERKLEKKKPVGRTDELALLSSKWHDVIDRVGKSLPLVRSSLIDTKPVEVNEDKIVIGFDPEFSSEVGNVEQSRNRLVIQRILSTLLGREVSVCFTVLDGDVELPVDHPVQVAEAAAETPLTKLGAEEKADKSMMNESANDKWVEDPQVRMILEAFQGDIIDVRE